MKINKICLLIALGLLVVVQTCSAWSINNGINNGGGGAGTAYEPVASPTAGTYTSAQSISLSASGANSIRYTVNDSTPSCTNGDVYSSAISVTSSKTIKSIACYNDNGSTSSSNVASHAYTINISSGGGGGGGGSTMIYCSSVTYADWGTSCFGAIQSRAISSQTPSGCTLTTAQQIAAQRNCQITTSTPPVATTTPLVNSPTVTGNIVLENIANEAQIMNTENTDTLLTHLGSNANPILEQNGLVKYKTILGLDNKITAEEKLTINDFIVYGTRGTQRLGAGERAAVINSYYQAYGKLPNSEAEWSDVLKIASGRWPSERSATAEARAKLEFLNVYRRSALMTNNIDENAIMIIAYGLLPLQRNLNSEKVAIKTFEAIYRHAPVSALAWNVVRAIAYSGATR